MIPPFTAANSAEDHVISPSTAAHSAEDHVISPSTAAHSAEDHVISPSTAAHSAEDHVISPSTAAHSAEDHVIPPSTAASSLSKESCDPTLPLQLPLDSSHVSSPHRPDKSVLTTHIRVYNSFLDRIELRTTLPVVTKFPAMMCSKVTSFHAIDQN